MSATEEYYERSKAAMLAGRLDLDTPPLASGPRYGFSAILRPQPSLARELTALADRAARLAGGEQWRLATDALHTTLRALEPHSTRPAVGDPQVADYAAALTTAARGFGAVELELRGVAVHPGGVVALGRAGGDRLARLRQRYVKALDAREVVHFEQFVRDLWYVSLVQFAAPVDVMALVEWAEANRDRSFGTAVFGRVDLVRWRLADSELTAEALSTAPLD